MTLSLPQIPAVFRIRLEFVAHTPIVPPPAIGAMWRGAFGNALRRMDPGAYQRLFEPFPPQGSSVKKQNMPSPFVIDADAPPDLVILPGETFLVYFTLIGEAVAEALIAVQAFEAAAADGLGKGRGTAELTHAGTIWSDDPNGAPAVPLVPQRPASALVVLRTPWRGGKEPFRQTTFRKEVFAKAVWDRAQRVCEVFDGDVLPAFGGVALEVSQLQIWPQILHRWSAKLGIEDDMAGTMGSFVLHLPNDDMFWAALWWSQWLHIGQKTSFGLGSVRVHPREG
ncbi:Uncharacterized conserved protein [Puniceibacterium sediminis]|uniref:Uncharacterized conserved protein n=2 Tax=Puniceibacterium sediminis TaxID=1608407 RepID=A0A238WE06_9RHOB|nr:Uncharacterized conserved protein [Puniceibacterium sediminis]